MTFLETRFLYAGFAGVIMIVLGFRQLRKRNAWRAAFSMQTQGIANAKPLWAEMFEIVLMGGAMICMAWALAGPLRGTGPQVAQRVGMDIVFAVDTSRSMLALDRGSSRLARARQEIIGVLEKMGGDRAGLVAFAGSARCICPLTSDLSSFAYFVDTLDIDSAPGPGSSLIPGMESALKLFGQGGTDRAQSVVLLSDGEDPGSLEHIAAASGRVRAEGVRVFTVMFGLPEGTFIDSGRGLGRVKDENGHDVLSSANPTLLRRIASEGGGCFVADQETAFPLNFLYTRHLARLAEGALQEDVPDNDAAADYQGILLAGFIMILCALFHPFRLQTSKAMAGCLIGAIVPLSAHAGEEPHDSARRGVELYRAENYMEARTCFEKAYESMPHESRMAVNLGLAWYKTGSFEKALGLFTKAFEAEDPVVRQAARFGAGLCAFRCAEHALALSEELDSSEAVSLLLQGLESMEASQGCFRQCMQEGAWKDESLANLALAERLLARMKARLAYLKEAQAETSGQQTRGTESEGQGTTPSEGDSTGEGEAATGRERGANVREDGEGFGQEPAGADTRSQGRGRRQALTQADKERILALLRDMEQRRIAMDKAEKEAMRQKVGGADW
ncbi:MAG: VWA domain-containing protein [Planctomycetota bacterium]